LREGKEEHLYLETEEEGKRAGISGWSVKEFTGNVLKPGRKASDGIEKRGGGY